MCLAIPGKIEKIEEGKIVVSYGVEKREAEASVVEVDVGDYVIVNNKVIINKLSKQDVDRFLELLND